MGSLQRTGVSPAPHEAFEGVNAGISHARAPPPSLPSLGVDPKTVLCEFHRHGKCTKGFKCKFSHDLNIERKTAKADVYSDK